MSSTGTEVHQILPPYDATRRFADGDDASMGQLIRTIVPNLCDTWKVFDAHRADQVRHNSAHGVIRKVDHAIDYRVKEGRLPIFTLRLGECEEMLAVNSKLRLCVILMSSAGIPPNQLPAGWERTKGQNAFRHAAYLVAPVFSIALRDERKAFGPTMAARIECLVYPQFAYLPRSGGIIQHDSVMRLDRAFWTTLAPPSTLEQLFLSAPRLGILMDQIRLLQGLPASDIYSEMAELLQLELKDEHRPQPL